MILYEIEMGILITCTIVCLLFSIKAAFDEYRAHKTRKKGGKHGKRRI